MHDMASPTERSMKSGGDVLWSLLVSSTVNLLLSGDSITEGNAVLGNTLA